MATENNNKTLNVPNLRFPEFSGEWTKTTLGKIGETFNGLTGKSGSDFGQGSPYITYKSIFDNSKIDLSRVEYVTITDAERKKQTQNEVQYGDIFFTTSSETPDEVGMTSVLLDEVKDCYLNSFCFGYRLNSITDVLPEYMRFYLRSNTIRRRLFVLAQGSTRFNISKGEVMGLTIKLPGTAEQRKIAQLLTMIEDRIATQIKIIEKLESLIKGLYERLFNIDGAAYIQLGNVAKIQKGQQINGEELSEIGSYYVMNGGVVPSGYLEDFNTPANTISISEGGNSCGYVQYNGVPFWSGGHCYTLIEPINSFNYKYLFHYLKFKEQSIMALRIGSGLPNIQKKDLERFPILNVSKEEQDKMACIFDDILDRIICERQIALKYEEQKKYLLSNLFI